MEPFTIAAIVVALGLAVMGANESLDSPSCVAVGDWLEPATGADVDHPSAIDRLARQDVVLLGESHTAAEHHRWQLHTIAALHGRRADIVLGFESFPRSVQPALDAWVAGDLTESAFLERSRWKDVWGFDPALYMPLFHYARLHRVPMIALNVDRALVRAVSRAGWSSVPPEEREGLGNPAPAGDAYRTLLRSVFEAHHGKSGTGEGDDSAFGRFVEAQTIWDYAMADAISSATREGNRLVVGIAGQGHLSYGYGIPHQMRALGVAKIAVALPVETGQACSEPDVDGNAVADLVFGVPEETTETASRD